MKKYFLSVCAIFVLAIGAFAQPANDACGAAQNTVPDGTCYAGTTVAANDNWVGTVGCQSGNHVEVWYSFVATGSQLTYNVTAGTMGNNIELVVVSSTAACTGLVIQGSACGPSPLTGTINGLQVGVTYYYTISTSGTNGTFTTCMTTTSPPPVAGQDCPTASILCTGAPFSQASSSAGFGLQEISTGNSCWGNGGERQSKWYRFTIGCSGTLAFTISPNLSTDDYDWVVYNITANPATCGLTFASTPVACNWSGCTGPTGLNASPATVPGVVLCGGPPGPCGGGTYPRAFCNETVGNMNVLNVTAGQVYALLIDNYTTSNNGFAFSFTGTATIGPNAVFSLISSNCGLNVTTTKTCPTANSTYLWAFGDGFTSTSAGPVSHTYATTGSYIISLTVTDALGCVDVYSQTVSGSTIASTSSVTNILCNGALTGSATATPTSGTAPYTYLWSPSGGTAATATGLGAGTYTCTITDAGGCSGTATVTITQPPAITATQSQVNSTCFGSCNGSATVVAAGGNGTYTYAWAPSGGTAATASSLCAGNYTCTISSPAGCSITQSFTITQPPVITATPSQVNVSCNASCNGSATVVAGGGNGTYTYAWAPSGGTAATASSLCAGNYTCTISSPAGCSITQSFTITQPPVITATPSQVNVSCNASCNGSATVVAAGGNGTYTYAWAPSGGTAATASSLCAGNYTCTISSPAGCSITQSFTITQPPVITATPSQVNVSCNASCNGSATVVAAGGNGTYTYAWAPSGGTAATASSLCAGNYTCTISSPAGCSITQSFTITQPPVITATPSQVNVSCNASCNGSATVVAAGGNGTYTYAWAPSGGTAATASSLCAGNYTCTISSPAGCSITQSFTITQPPVITATPSQVNVSCNASCNGSATVVAAGGNGTYTYAWAPSGGTAATASSLCAGNYTCTISSPAGCSITQSFTITQPPVITATPSQVNVSCNASCNGSATVVAAGGNGTYTYAWAPSGGTAATASSLCVGNYTCTISSPAGCSITQSFTITQPSAITATTASTNASCGNSDGTATVNPSGGNGPYTYTWSPSGGTNATATGLLAGSYTCTITDANGCILSPTVVVANNGGPTSAITSQTNLLCNGGNTGSATVTASGGSGVYSYSWAPSGGTNATATGLSAGTYTITITDSNGCITTQTATITEPSAVSASVSSQINIGCNGGSSGSATAVGTGGTGVITYAWSPSGGNAATATGLTAGTYTVVTTDINGCQDSATVVLTEPTVLSATISSQTDVTCNAGTNGSATVTPSGGSPGYTYSWSPSGGTGSTESNLSVGTYTCTITDLNGCVTTQTVTITEPTALTLPTASTNASCNASNGTASVTPSGGTGPYTYLWSDALAQTNDTASGLASGTYTVTVTDANACVQTATVVVGNNSGLVLTSANINSVSCFGGSDGTASVNATGGQGPYTYLWSPIGGTSSTAIGLPSNTYTVTVTDANGCVNTITITITQPTVLSSTISNSINIDCNGASTGSATVTGSGGTPAYTYAWSPVGGTNSTANGLPAGNYTCTITDANGCSTTSTISLTQPNALTASSSIIDATCEVPTGSATATPSGGTGPYTYQWNDPSNQTTSTASNLSGGTYTVTVTDANGCTTTSTVSISTFSPIVAGFTSNPISGPIPLTVTFTDNSPGAVTWFWDFGDNSTSTSSNPTHIYTTGGNYNVTLIVTNADGCMDTIVFSAIDAIAESELTVPNIFTPNNDGTNDVFLATQKNITTFSCEIYDRWGTLVYKWTDAAGGWDGKTTSGMAAVDGVYYYVLIAEGADAKKYELHGFVTLLK